MAILKNNIFHPSGTFGDVVYRQRNGKTVMYRRPQNQQVSRSQAAVFARDSFTLTTNYAAFINSFPYLKLAWKKAKVKGSNHFQKIIKNNAHLIKKTGITVHNLITPPGVPFAASTLSLSPGDNKLFVTFQVSEDQTGILDPSFILHLLFYFTEPKRKTTDAYNFYGIVNEISFIPEDGIYNLSFTLDETVKTYLRNYKKIVIFSAVCSTDPVGKKIFWTSTSAKEFPFLE